jgi:deoxycytidylate deaminase
MLDGVSPEGASISSTASPCYDCSKAIIRAGIKEVYFGQDYDSRYGLSGDIKGLLEKSGIKVRPLILSFKDGKLGCYR